MKESYIENFEQWKNDFSFYEEIRVRFSETDLFGHMNNTVPFVYFEQVRVAYLEAKQILRNALKGESDLIPVVADLQCDFLNQVYFNDVIKMYVKIARRGKSSIDLHYMGVVGEKVCFTGRGALVQMNAKTGKAAAWQQDQLNEIEF